MPTPTFTPVDPTALAAVTGGARSQAATEERLMDKLQSITTTIKDVAAQQQANQTPSPMSQLAPLLAMRMMQRGRL
ncbi:MAG: hypothetical protein R3B06_05165 [Kofleriaceae bacterium]